MTRVRDKFLLFCWIAVYESLLQVFALLKRLEAWKARPGHSDHI